MFFFLVASIACGGSIATEITPPLHGEQLKQFQRLSEASAFGGDKSWSLCYHEPWRCRTHFFYCWNMSPFLPIIIGSVEITLILKETHLGRNHFSLNQSAWHRRCPVLCKAFLRVRKIPKHMGVAHAACPMWRETIPLWWLGWYFQQILTESTFLNNQTDIVTISQRC